LMERMAWTDQRLDDLARRMDAGFARVDADIRELRGDMRDMRTDLSGQMDALRLTLLRVGGGMMIGLVGVIGAVLVSA
jgi:hypothetical protein